MSTEYENDSRSNSSRGSNKGSATRRAFLQMGAGALGVYGLLDFTDNGKLDLSPVRGQGATYSSSGGDDFIGGSASNSNNQSDGEASDPTGGVVEPTETPEDSSQTTSTPEPTPEPTPTSEPRTTSEPAYSSDLPDSCDRMYLQEDGTVVGVDIEDRQYRVFEPEDFPANSDLSALYDELEDSRPQTNLPADVGTGVRTTRQEVFGFSTEAYDDMADELEWDEIWDPSSSSTCDY
ncbi:hypothetical protein [Candidatus Nanohalococcus occultus]|uniref:hypothetical protein n=1 Tax=Candidatus Nanohalococcus occultus TaxID=2978047 RepID=UPI0039E13DF3